MDRNREARRTSIVGSNGFNRRKHRTNSLRDSPGEDGGVELQESIKLRDRVKKDRDRERNRGRDFRERETDRDLRERSGRSKRRRAERLMSNRDDIGTSDESENDDLDDGYEDTINTSAVARLLPPPAVSMSNHHQNHLNHQYNHGEQQHSTCNSTSNTNMISGYHHLQHRKSFPPVSASSQKVYRAPSVWMPGDEMIGVSVPRKARSACTKRLHDWASSSSHNNSRGGVAGGYPIIRQASSSPARQAPTESPARQAPTASPARQAPTSSPAPPTSPSSSNASTRKKLKLSGVSSNGPKLKQPKASLKPGSSNPEELEIEIAEVLYGLRTQSQAPLPRNEDSREVNRSTGDAKSRHSPSISNTTSAYNLIPGPNSTPHSAVAPKGKRPRQVLENPNYGARNSPKPEPYQTPKLEISSPNLERISGATLENGGNLVNSQAQPAQPSEELESMKLDSEPKPVLAAEMLKETRDLVTKKEVDSPKEKESSSSGTEEFKRVDSTSAQMASTAADSFFATGIKENPVESEIENLRQEMFQIDLMVPPIQGRSSPERDTGIDSIAAVLDKKPVSQVLDIELKPTFLKNEENENENGKRWRDDEPVNAAAEEKKGKVTGSEETESNKEIENKVRKFDLKLDLENGERDGGGGVDATATGNKALNKPHKEESIIEKTGQSTNSLPLPMSIASWPGGLPPVGYMAAPLQGVVPIDGTSVTPAPLQSFTQPRPKRCATHCHIARNIHSLQQFMKMHPFWPAAAGSPTLFGPKQCNLNVIPAAADLHGNVALRGVHSAQDKGQNIANAPNHTVKDKGSQSTDTTDSAQRKQQQQILIQQGLPPVPPSNLLAPAFIFPLNQHQAASVQPTPGKSSSGGNTAASASNISSSGATASASVPAGGANGPMNFHYPNMAVNETQYLAILQNNAYPFTIPAAAAVGPPANYKGTPAQAMPVFNGSFFPSQMINPSQIQQHQQQPPPSTQSHQTASVSGSSSSSQKHLQSRHHHHQRPQGSSGPGNANAQNFPSQKTQQQLQNQHVQRPRHFENEQGSEDSPLDNRALRASMNIYGQNFAMPIHPQNFALMTPPLVNASSGGNQNEKPQQPQQQPPPHSFAMSFGSMNGGPGIDFSLMAQNHTFFQSFPEAARQNLQIMAAAKVAQKKSSRNSEDGNNKSGGDDFSAENDDERKNLSVKSKSQSIVFARSDLGDAPNNVIESSARSLNVASGPACSSQAMTNNIPTAHIQSQLQQQHMLQLKHQQQQQQQQQLAGKVSNSRNKNPVSNGSMYSEHLNSKFPNTHSGFPQNLVQSNSNSPAQSPHPWKSSSTRTPTSQAQSSHSSSTVKNLPQQHNSQIRPQMNTQISFGGTQKRSTNSQGGQAPPSNNHQVPSPPMAIGSPTTSSISKGATGSPRMTNSASTINKMGQASALSTQQTQAQKSMSIVGNPSSSSGSKTQAQQQQQIAKNIQQHAQLYFSNPYYQAQSPHSTSGGTGGYLMQQQQWRRPDQQQPPGGPSTSSNGMLSLCPPVTLGTSMGTNDPAKAIAAATCNLKGGGLPSQGILHAAQFSAQFPAGFSYVHPVPTAVQVKPAEHKQPAGQPEKK